MTNSPTLPGTFNARDLGGLRAGDGAVRRGLLWRSDALVALGGEGRAAVGRLGLKVALDLREPVERRLDPPDLAGTGITVLEQPILGGEIEAAAELSLEQLYVMLLETRGHAFAQAVERVAEAGEAPAIVFCSAGKDRTGLVSALVLGAIGVPDSEIVADYARSEENMRGTFRAVLEARAIAAGLSEQELAVKIGAPPAAMWRALGWLREQHGGAAAYLNEHGLGTAELTSLRGHLIGEPLALAG